MGQRPGVMMARAAHHQEGSGSLFHYPAEVPDQGARKDVWIMVG